MSYDDDIASDVERFGWSNLGVSDASPPFRYSVGLMFTFNHPEVIIFGEPGHTNKIFAAVLDSIRKGRSFVAAGKYEGVLPGGPIATRPVDPSQHPMYLGFAMGYCTNRGRLGELEAVQVFWPDPAGVFPFERGCEDGVYEQQRRLDGPATPEELREFERFIGEP